ncbi:MAG: glycosyltransferase [Firmicutes bacterium]|nr:glycosyltransferase [Bacillota bacterium]
MGQLPDAACHGGRKGPEERRLLRLAKTNITFHKNVSDERLREAYQHARAFILPGEEDFGLATVEAQACGTPVIAADCDSGPRELLDHGRYGQLTPVRDPSALAAALRDARQERARWQAAAADGRAAVRERFSRDRVLRQLEATLWAVLRRS